MVMRDCSWVCRPVAGGWLLAELGQAAMARLMVICHSAETRRCQMVGSDAESVGSDLPSGHGPPDGGSDSAQHTDASGCRRRASAKTGSSHVTPIRVVGPLLCLLPTG